MAKNRPLTLCFLLLKNIWDLFRVRVRVSVSVRDLKIIKWIYATKVDICDKSGSVGQPVLLKVDICAKSGSVGQG